MSVFYLSKSTTSLDISTGPKTIDPPQKIGRPKLKKIEKKKPIKDEEFSSEQKNIKHKTKKLA